MTIATLAALILVAGVAFSVGFKVGSQQRVSDGGEDRP